MSVPSIVGPRVATSGPPPGPLARPVGTLGRTLARTLLSSAFRLATAAVAAFLLLSGTLIAVLFWQTNEVMTNQVAATLTADAVALRQTAADGLPALTEAVGARARSGGLGLYMLVDAGGRKLAGNLSRVPPEIEAAGRHGGAFRYRASTAEPVRERLAVATVLTLGDGSRLVIGRDVDDQRAFADHVRQLVLVGYGSLVALGLGTAFAISWIVLRRIEAVNATTREIMAGDLSRRVPLDGRGDELDLLAGNVNAMLERIEQLMAGLREVSDNIAHDLKTPLNRLRNRIEAALREQAPDVHRAALERTIEDADQLIQTFNALLLIARLEAAAIEESAAVVDIGAVVRDVAEFYTPVAEEAGLRLTVDAGAGLMGRFNRTLLEQAVANLLDNAIKYGRPPSATAGEDPVDEGGGGDGRGAGAAMTDIHVAASRQGDRVVIAVSDRGPGIAPADRLRVLRRFVRLDDARSAPGTGLGLSLVSAVARLHGGQVELGDSDLAGAAGNHVPTAAGGGLTVRLVLPTGM